MPINNSGPISLGGSTTGQSVNLELGKGATDTISMNDNDLRILAGKVGINPISFSDFYGKPTTPSITPTKTITPTVTPTPSVTITPTITPTPSVTPTVTITPSVTPPVVYEYLITYCNSTNSSISSGVQLSLYITYDYGGCFTPYQETITSGFLPTIPAGYPIQQVNCNDTACGGGGGGPIE